MACFAHERSAHSLSAPSALAEDGEIEEQLHKLEQMVKLLIHGKFTPEQAHYFCLHALPRSTSAALRLRLPHGLAQRLAGYLHFVLEAAAALLRRPDHWQVAEVVRVILTDAQAYHFYATSAAAPPLRHGAAAEVA